MAQTGRLGCGGNGTGASSKYEGQTKPWHRPKRTEALGIAGHRVWMTAELDEGEMGGEEAQPPPAFRLPGRPPDWAGRAPLEQSPRALRARLLETCREAEEQDPEEPGAAHTLGTGRDLPTPRLPGRAVSEESGGPGRRRASRSSLGPRSRTLGTSGRDGEVARSEKETSGPQRAEGRAETGAAPWAAHANLPHSLPFPPSVAVPGTASWRPRAPLPWCCLGCGPGAPGRPGAGPAPHVGSRPSPPRGLQRARSPRGWRRGHPPVGTGKGAWEPWASGARPPLPVATLSLLFSCPPCCLSFSCVRPRPAKAASASRSSISVVSPSPRLPRASASHVSAAFPRGVAEPRPGGHPSPRQPREPLVCSQNDASLNHS